MYENRIHCVYKSNLRVYTPETGLCICDVNSFRTQHYYRLTTFTSNNKCYCAHPSHPRTQDRSFWHTDLLHTMETFQGPAICWACSRQSYTFKATEFRVECTHCHYVANYAKRTPVIAF